MRGPVWRGSLISNPCGEPRLALAPAELTLVQCAASPDYWLLFGVLGAGTGCGLLFSNNLGAWRCRQRLSWIGKALQRSKYYRICKSGYTFVTCTRLAEPWPLLASSAYTA